MTFGPEQPNNLRDSERKRAYEPMHMGLSPQGSLKEFLMHIYSFAFGSTKAAVLQRISKISRGVLVPEHAILEI